IVDFQTGKHLRPGDRQLQLSLVNPQCGAASCAGLGGAAPLDQIAATDCGGFLFFVPAPASGVLGVGVRDPVGTTPANPLAFAVATVPVVAGVKYSLDGYLVLQSTLDGWAAADARFKSAGSYVGCFYNQPPPAATNLLFDEFMMPAVGVQLLENG